MNRKDTLSEKEVEQFYRLKHSLYIFADKKLNVLKDKKDWQDVGNNDLEDVKKVRDYIFQKNIDIIDQYLSKNPDNFNEDDLKILSSWKKAILCDEAILFKHTKENSLFLVKDNVYAVAGLMESFNEIFEGYAPLFIAIIILPFKERLVHEGLFLPYAVSIGKSMAGQIIAEAEEIIMKRGIISRLDKKEPVQKKSDEDLLKFYMKSERNQDRFFEDIEKLKNKTPELKAAYNYEVGRINARHIKKQLKNQDIKGCFGILLFQVIASGSTKNEMLKNLKSILPEHRIKEVYIMKLK